MIIKQVKQYGEKSKRQRIEFTKNDGFAPGEEVAIMPKKDYDEINQKIMEMKNKIIAKDSELAILKDQDRNLKDIVEDVNAPIHSFYKKELLKKDKEIKQLQMELKAFKDKTTQYNLDMQGLNIIEMVFSHKHKKLIQEFNDDIALLRIDPKIIVDADAPAIPGADDIPGNSEDDKI